MRIPVDPDLRITEDGEPATAIRADSPEKGVAAGMEDMGTEAALAAYRAGRPVLLRRAAFAAEAYLVLAARSAEERWLRFFAQHGQGRLGLVLTPDLCEALGLPADLPAAEAALAFTEASLGAAHSPALGGEAVARLRAIGHEPPHAAGPLASDPLLAAPRNGSPAPSLFQHGLPRTAITPAEPGLEGFLIFRAHFAGALGCPTPLNAVVDLSRLAGQSTPAAVVTRLDLAAGNGHARADLSAFAAEHGLHTVTLEELVALRRRGAGGRLVPAAVSARLPTPYGTFETRVFDDPLTGLAHVALTQGDIDDGAPVLTRLHSECLTGDIFGSLRCDCGSQLQRALARIGKTGRGVLLYLRQEGRGIGLANKLRAYALQQQGLDTVEANERLGFSADLREFRVAAEILQGLGVSRVLLMTNNPRKVSGLVENGVEVTERLPLAGSSSHENRFYLSTKRKKLGHLMELSSATAGEEEPAAGTARDPDHGPRR